MLPFRRIRKWREHPSPSSPGSSQYQTSYLPRQRRVSIALTNRQHAKALDDIPTASEAGYKSLEFDGLVGLFGPRDFPKAVGDRIATDIREIVADPQINSRLTATGQVVNPGSAVEFAAALRDQV